MQSCTKLTHTLACLLALEAVLQPCLAESKNPTPKSVLIVYHSGDPTQGSSPSLDKDTPDGFTHATTRMVNVKVLAHELEKRLTSRGVRVVVQRVEAIRHPRELLAYDGIILGSPVWFSNVSYPIKQFFDTHLIRIYEHRSNRLNDKIMSGFCTVMESGESGPRGLQALMWGLDHLTARTVEGMVVQTSEDIPGWTRKVDMFADRIARALRQD